MKQQIILWALKNFLNKRPQSSHETIEKQEYIDWTGELYKCLILG